MERTLYRISLDMNQPAAAVTLHAKRYDTGRSILATLMSGGVYPITEDCSAVFTARKPDGKVIYNACSIDGGRVRYDLTAQTTAAPGLMHCEIRLFGPEERLITSPRFDLFVEDTVYDENAEIESASEFTTLTGLISQIEEKLQNGSFKGDPFTYEDFTAEQLEDLRASVYGYYIPSVSGAGDLTWQPTGDTMPAVPAANIRGPAPVLGEDYFTEADKAAITEQVLAKTGDTFAPAGYGLGSGTPAVVTPDTLDAATRSGWYRLVGSDITMDNVVFNNASLFVCTLVDNGEVSECFQQVRPLDTNTVLTRHLYNGAWSEWECGNPPMAVGVEYRTTERWQGKPVYTMLADLGTTAQSMSGMIPLDAPGTLIRAVPQLGSTTCANFPIDAEINTANKFYFLTDRFDAGVSYYVICGANRVGFTLHAQLWYTKD